MDFFSGLTIESIIAAKEKRLPRQVKAPESEKVKRVHSSVHQGSHEAHEAPTDDLHSWKRNRRIILVERLTCPICSSEVEINSGEFVELIRGEARRLIRGSDGMGDALPQSIEYYPNSIRTCPSCLRSGQLIEKFFAEAGGGMQRTLFK